MAIGGLDIGSTGAKITVLEESGTPLHTGYAEYARNTGPHEVDPESIWAAVKRLLADAAKAVPTIEAVGITSFGESFALLDEHDGVLMPSMMYTDPRGEAEANWLREKLGAEAIGSIAGAAPHSMFSLPKLMWVKRNQPDLFLRAKRVCLIVDYLVYKLTGRRLIDYSLAARTMGLDVRNLCWSETIFNAADIDPALFSKPVPSGTDAGVILPSLAEELGVHRGLRVVVCCHDQVAAAVGAGVTRPGIAIDGAGTTQCVTPVFSPMPPGNALQNSNYPVVPFLWPDTYCTYAFTFTGGSLVKWFVDNFAGIGRQEAAEKGISVYDFLESHMRDEPTGILALPHFAGSGTPTMDTGSRGAVVGLTLSHRPADLYRAVLEGIAYEMRLNLERLSEADIFVSGLNASGGGAKSALWLQMKADILGVPVTRMSVDEAGTVGGIMLTGVATGVYQDLDEAAGVLVRPLRVYEPRQVMRERYGEHYLRYRGLYDAVRPLVGGGW